jgi:hypothetical protein
VGPAVRIRFAPAESPRTIGSAAICRDWARRQGALSFELRAATSLARLLRDQQRSTEAVALLAPVNDRFTEGSETADLKATKALIDGFYNSGEHKAAASAEVAKPLVELIPEFARRSAQESLRQRLGGTRLALILPPNNHG